MELLATILLEEIFQSKPPQVSDKNFAENSVRRALFVEIEFIEQTLEHIEDTLEFSQMWNSLSDRKREQFVEEVRLEYDVDTEIRQSGLSGEEFYQTIAKNASLLQISQGARGRLSTSLYDGSAAIIGVFSDYTLNLIVNVYSIIKVLRELFSGLSDNIGNYGVLPNRCLPVHAATEREHLMKEIEIYMDSLSEYVPEMKKALKTTI